MAKSDKSCASSCCTTGTAGSSCASLARSRANQSTLFLALGTAGGLLGGLALAKRVLKPASSEPKVSGLDTWQRALSETRGTVAAGFLSAQIQSRYGELYNSRPRFANAALRDHLEKNILPGLALYQVLWDDLRDQQLALDTFDRLLEAGISGSTMDWQGRLLGRMPDPFAVFRLVHNATLARLYPPEGWRFEWVEDSPEVIAYNCTNCFYHNILTHYGAPELTAHFCRLDDLMFSRFPYFAWKRTTTIGRGDACCNFRFEKAGMGFSATQNDMRERSNKR